MATEKPRILLIDDEASILLTFQIALVKHGYDLVTEQSPDIGLAKAIKEKFDALIIDYRMPGLHGIDIIIRLREQGCDTPVLLTSASESPLESLPEKYRANVSYKSKPLKPQSLSDALEKLLNSSRL